MREMLCGNVPNAHFMARVLYLQVPISLHTTNRGRMSLLPFCFTMWRIALLVCMFLLPGVPNIWPKNIDSTFLISWSTNICTALLTSSGGLR